MDFSPASSTSLLAFLLIVVGILMSLFAGMYVACKRIKIAATKPMLMTIILAMIWLGICSSFVASGHLKTEPIPYLPLFFVISLGSVLVFSFSSFGSKLAIGIPLQALVAFQGFRFFLELVLHTWSEQATVPTTMTWTGQNFDILSGAVALMLTPFVKRWRSAAWVVNVLGILLLLNVIRVAILSSPLPFGWNVVPPLQLVFYFPYFLIVPVCIGGALAGHVILTRALLLQRQK